ncbi:MAG: NAD+ synthase [Candidatus Bathyarchaeum tardum]|nr:MAG: NAD+ synthase [Candidatus Bathyarchaeum tardum]
MLKVAMAQINATVGDLQGNIAKIRQYLADAKSCGAELVVFPELAVTGYPPQDLLLENGFVLNNKRAIFELIENNTADVIAVVGFVDYKGKDIYNAAAVFQKNQLLGVVHKALLPTYDVFDEDRYFKPAKTDEINPVPVTISGKQVLLGVEICEDLWDTDYEVKVTDLLVERGAQLVVNLSASPFLVGKQLERHKLLVEKASKNKVPVFYVNLVGGQDELVFDGQSMAMDKTGNLVALSAQFTEDLVVTDIDLTKGTGVAVEAPLHDKVKEMFGALVLGIHDYFAKTGFEKAVIGLSGGIDSSVTAAIAVEALGKQNVIGVSMPSQFSSDHSKSDAEQLAENLGICFVQIGIQNVVNVFHEQLNQPLQKIRDCFGTKNDQDDPVADENIQPRVRGNILMDISNRLKELKILVLNTGNKTEIALGFCTLYGDMAGGIGVLGDVSKLEVYKLAHYINSKTGKMVIPKNVIEKRPSPELKECQFDPFDFDIVSPLVDEIIENRRSKQDLIKMGYPEAAVDDTYQRVRNSEYKRRQATPCIKITPKAFGIGWKMPMVNKYKG